METSRWSDTLTVGSVLKLLNRCEPDSEVWYDFAYFVPHGIDSYRGYYEELALGYMHVDKVESKPTVEELTKLIKGTIGKTFEGYKGGSYRMDEDTGLWVSNCGEACGTLIHDIQGQSKITHIITRHEYEEPRR